jgi:hypothetical protein
VKTNDKCEEVVVIGVYHRRMRHGFRFLLPPFSTILLFQNFHINHSFFKIFIIIRFSSFDNISRRHTSWIIRVFCVRLLILSNEEKRMIMKIVKKEWFIWKFWKRGVVEKRGRRKRNPCPMRLWCLQWTMCLRLYGKEDQDGFNELAD